MLFLKEFLQSFMAGGQPWWVYAVALLIPICIIFTIREFLCWFWKINALVTRLERLEKSIDKLASIEPASNPAGVQSFSRTTGKVREGPSEL